jgi:hypothetical protein
MSEVVMLQFLTPQLFEGLIWAVILIGGALAILRLVRDLTGPPRWPKDDEEVPPGGGSPTAGGSSEDGDPLAPDVDDAEPAQRPPDA